MKDIFMVTQIALSISLVFLVMIQPKGNKSFTRRGLERLLYKLTYIVSALFLINAIIMLLV